MMMRLKLPDICAPYLYEATAVEKNVELRMSLWQGQGWFGISQSNLRIYAQIAGTDYMSRYAAFTILIVRH